jgi:hypothetical protein
MTLANTRTIDDTLRGFPVDDRIASLIITLFARSPDFMRLVLSCVATINVASRRVSRTDQIIVAELLRDAADEVEHRRARIPG